MTDLLDALSDRAGRARPDPDLDSMIADAETRGHALVRRRRAGTAGAAAALALAAVTVGLVTLLPDRSAGKGGVPPLLQPEPSSAASASGTTPLVAAKAAPAKAPVSLGLLPAGWGYLDADQAITEYGELSDRHPEPLDTFARKIAIGPHDADSPLRLSDFPSRVGKYRANYHTSEGAQIISIFVKGSITVDLQIPPEANLSKASSLRMAASVTIRDVSNPSHG